MSDEKKHKTDADKSQYRRDKIKEATPATLTKDERALMTKMYQVARQMSTSTGTKYQVDHIVPLAVGGLHVPENLQIITEEQNKKRGATSRLPEEGAILSHMVKENIRAGGGKFVKGISGNPKGRPKKKPEEGQYAEAERLLTQMFLESKGNSDEFDNLMFSGKYKIDMPATDLINFVKKLKEVMRTQQKINENSEERIEKIEFNLTTPEEYAKLKNKYVTE